MALLLTPAAVELTAAERDALVAAITRRRIVIGGAAAALAGPSAAFAQTPMATPFSSGFPRTIIDARGVEVTVPARPEHIYTVRRYLEYNTVLALGVVPAAWGTFPDRVLQPYQVAAGGVENGIDVTGGADLEEMLLRDIDLIVAAKDQFVAVEEMGVYAELGVPIIALPNFGVEEQLRIVGEALGLEAEAAARYDEYAASLAEFRPAVLPGSLSLVMVFGPGQLALYTPGSSAGLGLEELGLPRLAIPETPAAGGRQDYVELSLERANEIDAEWVIGLDFEEAAGDTVYAMVEREPVFQAIPAVQNGRYRTLRGEAAWVIASPDVLTMPIIIEALTEVLRPE